MVSGCDNESHYIETSSQKIPKPDVRSFEERTGTYFGGEQISRPVEISAEVINLESAGDATSIWGALGVSEDGSIWIGLSGSEQMSGQLFQLLESSNTAYQRGAVRTQRTDTLTNTHLASHRKIHSRIRQALDGRLYFSSMDETDESWRENRLPKYGSHIWSIDPSDQTSTWKLEYSAPEAIIAVESIGRYVYALGYWEHLLYQYDTHTGKTESLRVGADCGHVSRNFLVGSNGRVFVPTIRKSDRHGDCGAENMVASLVEISDRMQIIHEHSLINFLGKSPASSHQGITAFTYRKDQTLIFGTQSGELYHLVAHDQQPALVLYLGNIDAKRRLTLTNLISIDGKSTLGAFVHKKTKKNKKQLALLTYDMKTSDAIYTDIELPSQLAEYRALLLYGSGIRDKVGRVIVGGRMQRKDGHLVPILLRAGIESG